MKQIPKSIQEIARKLRNNMTPAEIRLWARIKNSQLWIKFLRQKPICVLIEDSWQERYVIPDFYCFELQIVIEVDGIIHDQKEVLELDKEKEKLLKHHWMHIIRLTNKAILENTDICIRNLQNDIAQLSLWKREYPKGEGFYK